MLAAEQPNEGAVHVLRFPNGNRALCVTEDVERDSNTGALLARLKLDVPSRPVIVVCGGADDLVGRRLRHVESVLGAAVALAAGAHGAAVVDGGTAAGVMAVIGSARKHREKAMPLLIGVAPSERIGEVEDPLEDIARFEAHHTHFVLARSDSWGGETGLMFRVADSLAGPKRAVVVLAGGGDVAAKEVLEAVQRGWPVIVLSRSGGLAKDLANVWRRTQPSMWRAVRWFRSVRAQAHLLIQRDSEATLRPIARDGDLRLFGDHDAPELARWLAWEFSDDEALKDGWRLYARYNNRATELRSWFGRFQIAIIVLGVVATSLALAFNQVGGDALRWTAIMAPSLTAVTVAIANWLGAGQRWVLLRGAAEAAKEQIYRYRTGTGPYNEDGSSRAKRPRAETLAENLGAIDVQLYRTEASSGPLGDDAGSAPPNLNSIRDNSVSDLDGDSYIKAPLGRPADVLPAQYKAPEPDPPVPHALVARRWGWRNPVGCRWR